MNLADIRCSVAWSPFSLALAAGIGLCLAAATGQSAEQIDYARDILPILSDTCYHCHGPDAQARQADLRLDTQEGAFGLDGGVAVIVAGNSEESELIRRIFSDEPWEVMPPADSIRSLSDEQRELLRRWVDQGANWGEHWSFRPLQRPPLPAGSGPLAARATQAVDLFVDEAQVARGLVAPLSEVEQASDDELSSSVDQFEKPGRPDDKHRATLARLMRRVTLDLTGLPPTPDEVDAFLADRSPDAYEQLVDRLLASPRFGERMASEWLDLARFADTHGYQMDRYRAVWPYRDWVIQAFNENLPFDQFVTWQLAGDLLPDATKEQRLATTFQRLHMQNEEGGIVEEEFRVAYVVDRVNTFGTAFLGMTFECARCHDHKYDPITQRDFYSLFAFFQNIDESGQTSYFTASMPVPTLLLSSDEQDRELERLEREISLTEQELSDLRADARTAFADWRQQPVTVDRLTRATPVAMFPLDQIEDGKTRNVLQEERPGHAQESPEIVDLETSVTSSDSTTPVKAVRLSGEDGFTFPQVGHFSRVDPFSFSLRLETPDHAPRYVVLHHSRAPIDAGSRGYELLLEEGRVAFGLHHMWPGNSLKVRTRQTVTPEHWTHVTVSYDGSSRAAGIHIHVDGEAAELEVIRDGLGKDITYEGGEPDLTLGYRFRDNGFRRGKVADLRVFAEALTPVEARLLSSEPPLEQPLAVAISEPAESSETSQTSAASETSETSETSDLESGGGILTREVDLGEEWPEAMWEHYWQREFPEARPLRDRLARLRREHNSLINPIPEIMVMEELPEPKPAYILRRGEYHLRGEQVTADTPAVLPPFPDEAPRDRLGLAQWLLDPSHPLMARVTVNRVWQMLLGRGIVDTADNFGFQGGSPTHPELLDWLAREFIEDRWDQKELVRKIVLSATYRQVGSLVESLGNSPGAPPNPVAIRAAEGESTSVASDPDNRWLTRGPTRRLTAEMLRDQALAASGLLVEQLGGPSVKPYQPEGLWDIAMGKPKYEVGQGADRYRRSLYTYWKRTVPPPAMVTFDAAERNNCTVQRQSTSTPIQALVLLNDPQFTEAARRLGQRMVDEAGDSGETDEARVEWLFRVVMARRPSPDERKVLMQLYQEQCDLFRSEPEEAHRFLGLNEPLGEVDPRQLAERAAAGILASALLNHDEAVTRR